MPPKGSRGGGHGRGRGGGRGRGNQPAKAPKSKPSASTTGVAAATPEQILTPKKNDGNREAKRATPVKPPPDCRDPDLNAKVSRCYTHKLTMFDRQELKLVGKTTALTVHAYIYRGYEDLIGTSKNLSTDFWSGFWVEFGLSSDMFQGIDGLIGEDDVPDPEVTEALLQSRLENPADRKTGPFVRWTELADATMSLPTCCLMLVGTKPGDRVLMKHHEIMLKAALKCIGRLKLWEKFPAMWDCVRDDAESFLVNAWNKAGVKDDAREWWLTSHRHALSPILDVPGALDIVSKDFLVISFVGAWLPGGRGVGGGGKQLKSPRPAR